MGSSCRTFREEFSSCPRCLPGGILPASPVRVPETPPDLPLQCHTRAGFSLANNPLNRRGRGGD
jgi:hypothetical protein